MKTNICSPPLEHHHRVGLQVGQVQLPAFFNHVRMLAHQQPANVGEEEPPLGVVGVRIRLGELVVDTVVPGPLKYVVLAAGRGGKEGLRGFQMDRLTTAICQ